MPKIDIAAVPKQKGSRYPSPFDVPCAERVRQRLGNAGDLTDFGVNLMHLPPRSWSSQRHWHSHEDEFVYVLARRRTNTDRGWRRDGTARRRLRGLSKRLRQRPSHDQATAVYLEVGSRQPEDLTTCSEIDMMSSNADGRFVHKDGTANLER
jgi:uncharacterized cupin superfamily protein